MLRCTIFGGADLMLGPWASVLTVTVIEDYRGLLFAILPPGAFMGLAVLIAIKNKIDSVKVIRKEMSASQYVTFDANKA